MKLSLHDKVYYKELRHNINRQMGTLKTEEQKDLWYEEQRKTGWKTHSGQLIIQNKNTHMHTYSIYTHILG